MQYLAAFAVLAVSVSSTAARQITVYNNCPFTIWPAMFTDLNVGNAVPDHPTGWEQAAYQAVSFSAPNNWQAGRIWGRRDCDFSKDNGPNACVSGGCNGGLVCDPHTGTGVPPASLAEFTLSATDGLDYYDVSLVDGYNLPVQIKNTKGCRVADCPVDLAPGCPSALKGPFDGSGTAVGCKSSCLIDADPSNSAACCSGSHNTPATCPNSGVPYYDYFKSNCPNAYAYAYDESSESALFTCTSTLEADYTVTFCP